MSDIEVETEEVETPSVKKQTKHTKKPKVVKVKFIKIEGKHMNIEDEMDKIFDMSSSAIVDNVNDRGVYKFSKQIPIDELGIDEDLITTIDQNQFDEFVDEQVEIIKQNIEDEAEAISIIESDWSIKNIKNDYLKQITKNKKKSSTTSSKPTPKVVNPSLPQLKVNPKPFEITFFNEDVNPKSIDEWADKISLRWIRYKDSEGLYHLFTIAQFRDFDYLLKNYTQANIDSKIDDDLFPNINTAIKEAKESYKRNPSDVAWGNIKDLDNLESKSSSAKGESKDESSKVEKPKVEKLSMKRETLSPPTIPPLSKAKKVETSKSKSESTISKILKNESKDESSKVVKPKTEKSEVEQLQRRSEQSESTKVAEQSESTKVVEQSELDDMISDIKNKIQQYTTKKLEASAKEKKVYEAKIKSLEDELDELKKKKEEMKSKLESKMKSTKTQIKKATAKVMDDAKEKVVDTVEKLMDDNINEWMKEVFQ